jgi:beta-N-acetylhexosaminidase
MYPALDRRRPAALSRRIATRELRGRLGFRGVSMTDALGTPATAPFGGPGETAYRAAQAGVDLMLYTSYDAGKTATREMARAIEFARLDRSAAVHSLKRVLAVRHRLR